MLGSEESGRGDPKSGIDGKYFKEPRRWQADVGAGAAGAVAKKFVVNAKGQEAVYYQRGNGAWEHAEFGTTCTCCMVLNAGDEARKHRKVVVTAHVGDR